MAYGKFPALAWIYGIPVLLVLQFVMVFGVSMFIASINLFFRDLERLTGLFMTLLFYFTPVIYSENMIPDKYRMLVNLNPVAPLMISWRTLFLEGKFDLVSVMLATVYSAVFYLVGKYVYSKLSVRFGEIL